MTALKDHSSAQYIERLKKIRLLSSPSLEGISDADIYSDVLRDNFIHIGKLAAQTRQFLESELFPMLSTRRDLTPEETEELIALGEELLSAADVENLDLPIMSLISNRLLQDAVEHDDTAATIRRLDMRMDTCYALMIMIGRVSAYPEIADRFRQEGLGIGRKILDFLRKDTFRALDASSRETLLTDARYMAVFYEGNREDEFLQSEELKHLDAMLALSENPFYTDLTPDFNWRYFRYRTLNYYAKMTDLGNVRGFGPELLQAICDRTEVFVALWHSDEAYYSQFDSERQIRLLLYRNRYLAGRCSRERYRAELEALYAERNPWQYDLNGICDNLELPAEIVCLLDPLRLSDRDARRLSRFYRHMIQYGFNMPNSGSLSSMLEYYFAILERFIELPQGPSFEEMGLQCLAALHPPTYIHSVMVAKLASCLCGHLIDADPGRLAGALGCATAEQVRQNRQALMDFTFHAALCHDFGKLSIIDTIFVYGRNLFDMEFELIRTHPRSGWQLLTRYDSTRPYADIALGHHRWYDGSQGYPEDFDSAASPLKPIIDLVLCADCLDAATDRVGRSYSRGKSLDEFIAEIRPECGTHYPPWLAQLLTQEDAHRDILDLLTQGRLETYQKTYKLLKRMSELTD